jgi:hypothetical protein
MTERWSRRLGARARRWALGRHVPARSLTLTQKRIFIFPTRAGLWFLFAALVILLLGINYENNLVYAVSFVLLSLFVVSILHTYSNLAGLTITALAARPCLVGESAEFELLLLHLTSLSAVIFRQTQWFQPVVGFMDRMDQKVFSMLPFLRKHAWAACIVMREPRKVPQ